MIKFCKLKDDNKLEFAPSSTSNVSNYNLECNREMLLEDGWKPLIEAEKPTEEYTIFYEEDEDEIREIIHILTPEEIVEKEHQRVLQLKCTKRVFAIILDHMGVSYDQLRELIATDSRAQLEWDLCVELERKNTLLDVMAERLGFSSDTLDKIFKAANDELTFEELMKLYYGPEQAEELLREKEPVEVEEQTEGELEEPVEEPSEIEPEVEELPEAEPEVEELPEKEQVEE